MEFQLQMPWRIDELKRFFLYSDAGGKRENVYFMECRESIKQMIVFQYPLLAYNINYQTFILSS